MTRKLILTSLCACLFAGCNSNPNARKAYIHRNLKTSDDGTNGASGSGQKNKLGSVISGSKGCLPLKDIADALKGRSNDAFALVVKDLDLVDGSYNSLSIDDQTRARVLIVTPKAALVETFRGSALMNSTIKPFLSIDPQSSGCDSVTFLDDDGKTKHEFTVEKVMDSPNSVSKLAAEDEFMAVQPPIKPGTPAKPGNSQRPRQKTSRPSTPQRALILKSKEGEKRVYSVAGNQLTITDYVPAPAITDCNQKSYSGQYMVQYVLDFGNAQTFVLDRGFAALLQAVLLHPGPLDPPPSPPKGAASADPGPEISPIFASKTLGARRLPTAPAGTTVSVTDLEIFTSDIRSGLLKSIECKSTP